MTQTTLLEHLEKELRYCLDIVRNQIATQNTAVLQARTSPEHWNALECFAHLNAYLERYIPRMELSIHKAKAREWKTVDDVNYSGAGKRFIKHADPENRKAYKSPKYYNFWQKDVGIAALKGFTINTERLLRVIQAAKEVNLNKAKVSRGKSGFFSLSLGNTLEWQVLHIQRHIHQIQAQIVQLQNH